MTLTDLFTKAQNHLNSQYPFVLYHSPNEDKLKGVFLNTIQISYSKSYTEEGFIFAPFDSNREAIIFKKEDSELIEVEYSRKELETLNPEESVILISPSQESAESHATLVRKGIQAIKSSVLKKVVLSRMLDFENDKPEIDICKSLFYLYPEAFTYFWYHPKVGTWCGASPETLIDISGSKFETMALAGTKSEMQINQNLDWTAKEKEEHDIVIKAIVDALEDESRVLNLGETTTSNAGKLQHLKTRIHGSLKSNYNLKNILSSLHPTPAVCGTPTHLAKAFISENEDYDREYYTGFLGELNMTSEKRSKSNKRNIEQTVYGRTNRQTKLFVNLRCMQLKDSKALIYLGGGITAESDAEDEFWETHRKAQTMLSVL